MIAPIDADGGGTWIAANERGLTVCLLNHYPDAGEPLVRESSGDRRSSGDNVGSYSNRRRAGEGLPTPFGRESGRRKSRGLLVLELSSAASCAEVTRALGTAGPSRLPRESSSRTQAVLGVHASRRRRNEEPESCDRLPRGRRLRLRSGSALQQRARLGGNRFA